MDSFFRDESAKTPAGAGNSPGEGGQHQTPTTSELFSSAKVVADAARAKFSNQEYDQGKAAGAAADLLGAASHYGKLEEDKGLGKIVDKAEDYLHKYSSTTTTTHGSGHSTTTTTETTTHTSANPGGEHGQSGGGYGEYVKMAEGFLKGGEKESAASQEGGHGKSGGGYGEYIKMAEGLLNKGEKDNTTSHSEGGHEKSGGGYGDYMKMAGDFLKKN